MHMDIIIMCVMAMKKRSKKYIESLEKGEFPRAFEERKVLRRDDRYHYHGTAPYPREFPARVLRMVRLSFEYYMKMS